MIKNITLSLPALLMLIMLVSCQKEEEPQLDLSAPIINIVTPKAEESYEPGQEILLHIEFFENQELHDYSIVIRNEDRSFTQTLAEGHIHDRNYVVETGFVLPENDNQTYTLTVKATDHNDNLTSQQLTLYVP